MALGLLEDYVDPRNLLLVVQALEVILRKFHTFSFVQSLAGTGGVERQRYSDLPEAPCHLIANRRRGHVQTRSKDYQHRKWKIGLSSCKK